jgi:hypothetical protein
MASRDEFGAPEGRGFDVSLLHFRVQLLPHFALVEIRKRL